MVSDFLAVAVSDSQASWNSKFKVLQMMASFLGSWLCPTYSSALSIEVEKRQKWAICTTEKLSYCWCWLQKLLSTYVHKIHLIRFWLPLWCSYLCLCPCPKHLGHICLPSSHLWKYLRYQWCVHNRIRWDSESSVTLPSPKELQFFSELNHTWAFGLG